MTISFGGMTFQRTFMSIEEERDFLRQRVAQLESKTNGFVVILDILEKTVFVSTGDGLAELKRPPGDGLKIGMTVRVNENGAIIGPAPFVGAGPVVPVKQVLDEKTCEVDTGSGGTRVVVYAGDPPKPGDKVVLGLANAAIIRNIGRGDTSRVFAGDTGITWEDIGGQEEAKRAMVEAIEEPHTKRAVYERFGLPQVKGVLLYGPPGNGKTMLGKAAATALARIHGKSAKASGFLYVKGPDILNKFVGESEANIRGLFTQARAHKAEHGYPALLFIDEADAVFGKRGETRWEGMERTIVPMFLAEMDGLEESAALVVLATNRPDSLDPAVVRDGRIDRKVHVRKPTTEEAREIFLRAVRRAPMATGAGKLADHAVEQLFSPGHALYMVRVKDGKHRRIGLAEFVSGAMVVGVAHRAIQLAVRRAVAENDANGGLCELDVSGAVLATFQEHRNVNHANEIRDVVADLGDNVVSIDRVKP